jgi:nitrate/TMAO reductase-like tetraheme cytochrome c subunit
MSPKRLSIALSSAALLVATACSESHRETAPPIESHLTSPEDQCASCHPQHVEEWRSSAHAYAVRDPVFSAMVDLGQRETQGKLGDFCVQCHSPLGFLTHETKVRFEGDGGGYVQPTRGLFKPAMDGVSCAVCHSITKVNTAANADYELATDDVRRATIMDPEENPAHESEYSALLGRSELCGSCHVVVNPNRVALERTHIEWLQSIFAGAKSCQDCHMPAREGVAAVGRRKRTVHEHAFVGVDVSLLPEDEFPGYDEQREKTRTLLEQSATLSARAAPESKRLELEIKNLAGHSLPSGATADRQMWVELVVTDEAGNVVLESGTLDENGDLRVVDPHRTTRPGTDPHLLLYGQEMLFDPKLVDPSSTEPVRTVEFLWEPNSEVSHLIPPSVTDRPSFDLSELPSGSYKAELRLLFRSFAPHLLRRLEEVAGLDAAVRDRVPTVEMARATVSFVL